MAGSYEHVMAGWSLIENMGDAYEAVEELLWLVQEKIGTENARKALINEYYPMERGEIPKSKALLDVKKRMAR